MMETRHDVVVLALFGSTLVGIVRVVIALVGIAPVGIGTVGITLVGIGTCTPVYTPRIQNS